jgi:hypothetical protein
MPRRSTEDISNFDQSKELPVLTQKAQPIYHPPVKKSS